VIARLLAWIKSETELATAETWAPAEYSPLTSDDPKCAETLRRMAECRDRMKRMKSGLLDGSPQDRPYTRGADVEATFNRARAIVSGPVRMVTRKVAR
jgi:hypothetical protein